MNPDVNGSVLGLETNPFMPEMTNAKIRERIDNIFRISLNAF